MNVRELIHLLMLMDQDSEVVARDGDGVRVVVEAEDVEETTMTWAGGGAIVQITPY